MSCGWNVNMISAITKCLEIVDDPSKIIMDIMTMYPNTVDTIANQNYTSYSNYMRKKTIKSQTTLLSDISEFIRANPTINYRYLV